MTTIATTDDGRPGPPALYMGTLAPGSRRAAHWRIKAIGQLMGRPGVIGWASMDYADAVELRGRAAEQYGPRTAAALFNTFRAVCRQAWMAGAMSGETYRRIEALPGVTGEAAPVGRFVPRPELRALFDACAGDRDRVLLAVLFGAGLRRSEAAGLMTTDLEGGAIVVQRGKGNRGRRVPIGPSVSAVVVPWAAKLDGGPLLRATRKGGRVTDLAMSGEAIRRALARLCRRAGVPTVRPHDARRTFISNLLDAGVDLAVVSRLVGHKSVQVTAGYDRRGERAEIEAANLVRLPASDPTGTPETGSAPLPQENTRTHDSAAG